MREKELLQHARCDVCSQPIGSAGVPLFWTAKFQRHGIKLDAVDRQIGLGMMLGSHRLASVMGPDADMTVELVNVEVTICETCGTHDLNLHSLVEYAERRSRTTNGAATIPSQPK